jgi:F0F1-type ATP synthase membrane subunit c/vacuolar-type H+-ATPase subunit K
MEGPTDTSQSSPQRTAPTSRLAVGSIVVGSLALLLSCCGAGFGGMFAVLLGMFALDRIKSSGGMLRGRPLAWAGIACGATAFVVSIGAQLLVSNLQESINRQLDGAIAATFAAVDGPGEGAALGKWRAADGQSIEATTIGAFAREVKARYGAFDSCKPFSEDSQPSLSGMHRLVVATAFQFEKERLVGSVSCVIRTSMAGFEPLVELESIQISDPVRGALSLPASASAEPEGTSPEPATSDASTAGESSTSAPAEAAP